MKGRTNEISNPVKYYKQESNYYDNFHDAEISYFDYNYNNMIKQRNNSLNVNPYNRVSSDSNLGKSFLRRNPILTPLHDYSYNKYFDRESFNVNNNIQSERTRNSLVQAGNSIFGN